MPAALVASITSQLVSGDTTSCAPMSVYRTEQQPFKGYCIHPTLFCVHDTNREQTPISKRGLAVVFHNDKGSKYHRENSTWFA